MKTSIQPKTPDAFEKIEQQARRQALDLLLERRSTGMLEEPAPDGEDLDRILDAGLRAPDHGRLRPWRFVVIRGDARTALGECLAEAVKIRDPAAPPSLADRYRAWANRTPLLIAVGARINSDRPIPEIEQVLSAGAAAMNMLNATHLLGYAGIWVTGPNSYDARVNAALGFHAPDRLVGFLAVGTSKSGTSVERPDRSAHVVEWKGPPQAAELAEAAS
jgi:nitroreductase